MGGTRIIQVDGDSADIVIDLVAQLLRELGEEGDEAGDLDAAALTAAWRQEEDRQFVFLAIDQDESPVGVATVTEAFALYAGGHFGIINETYVTPAHRSTGVGGQLIEAVKSFGRDRGWRRVDVTAPESERWNRTRQFYEQHAFTFAGPKLKCTLS